MREGDEKTSMMKIALLSAGLMTFATGLYASVSGVTYPGAMITFFGAMISILGMMDGMAQVKSELPLRVSSRLEKSTKKR